jgi:hypothetical protein
VDESATGSVNFFGPVYFFSMHLPRPPAIAHGVTSLLWGIVLGVFIWKGGDVVGFGAGVSFIAGAVGGFLIFLFVRIYGEDEPRRP